MANDIRQVHLVVMNTYGDFDIQQCQVVAASLDKFKCDDYIAKQVLGQAAAATPAESIDYEVQTIKLL